MKKSKFEVEYPKVKVMGRAIEFDAPVADKTAVLNVGGGTVMLGSTGGYEDGWLARITLAPNLHLQLFPKYGLVAMELNDNGNTNLPAGCSPKELLQHLFKLAGGKPLMVRPNTGEYEGRDLLRFKYNFVYNAIVELQKVAEDNHEKWSLNHDPEVYK